MVADVENLAPSQTTELVLDEWRKQTPKGWVESIMSNPETSEKLKKIQLLSNKNEVEALNFYLSGCFLSQI